MCPGNTFIYGRTCVDECPSGTYLNGAQCLSCTNLDLYCVKCSSLQSCSKCSGDRFAYDSTCVTSCPANTYGYADAQCVSFCPDGTEVEGSKCETVKMTNVTMIVVSVVCGVTGLIAIILLYRYIAAKKLSKIRIHSAPQNEVAKRLKVHVRKSFSIVES